MHELSIALSILDCAEEEAEKRGAAVVAIHLRLGPLSGVVKEALRSAYDMARAESRVAQAELVIEDAPLLAYCPSCAAERTPRSLQDLRCPDCHTPMPDIRGGRELEVIALEIET